MRLAGVLLAVAALAALMLSGSGSQPAHAVHHIAEISEVMSGFDGDPDIQFVEIKRLDFSYAGQGFVANTRLSAFNPDGTLAGILLDPVGADFIAGGVFWIMGTSAFETASGLSVDFTFSPGILPSAGMVCWGAPGSVAPDPNTWDASDPNNYVDCVSYGGVAFTGTNPMSPNPASSGAGNDTSSLTRVATSTGKAANPWRNSDDATDFALLTPSPKNDAGEAGELIPSTPAPVGGVSLDGGLSALSEAGGSAGWLMAGILSAMLISGSLVAGAAAYRRRRP